MSESSTEWYILVKRCPEGHEWERVVHRSYLPTLIAETFMRGDTLISVTQKAEHCDSCGALIAEPLEDS